MPTTELKLTKKKKKALAFRSRTKKPTNGYPSQDETENLSLFALGDEGHGSEDDPASQDGRFEAADVTVKSRDKGKARMDGKGELAITQAARSRKRKRDLDGVSQDSEMRKRLKQDEDVSGAPSQDKNKGKERLILFAGNLKFRTTVDGIKEHFSACDPPPSVRLLTPKASTAGKQPTKSKGCAFLEFSNRKALQQALELHHSKLDGRVINVELTAGGGGKSKARLEKLRERNKHLHSQRQEKRAKGGTKNKEGSGIVEPDQSQRYSATSGVGKAPKEKRTWTVGDVAGEKKARSRRRSVKDQATGVNAIPVG